MSEPLTDLLESLRESLVIQKMLTSHLIDLQQLSIHSFPPLGSVGKNSEPPTTDTTNSSGSQKS